MQVKFTHKVTYASTLELTEQAANWLHHAMQNPLYGQDPSSENQGDREIRLAFFEATNIRAQLQAEVAHAAIQP